MWAWLFGRESGSGAKSESSTPCLYGFKLLGAWREAGGMKTGLGDITCQSGEGPQHWVSTPPLTSVLLHMQAALLQMTPGLSPLSPLSPSSSQGQDTRVPQAPRERLFPPGL